jgi:3-phenylpropionate/trans-cinnamate dioxygenase ferredoxin reductase subunit
VHLDDPVMSLDAEARTATTAAGREFGFGTCVLATGARAVPPPWPSDRVHAIRTYDDALALNATIARGARRFLVIGGGFLGLETASALADAGCEVAVVEASQRLLTGRTSAFMSNWLAAEHTRRGIAVTLGAMVGELSVTAADVQVRLTDGTEIAVDKVVFAVGALANDDLARAIGADCGRGVLVDDTCATSVPGIYAIGDVASGRTGTGAESRIESVFNATSQAKVLAAVLAGKESRPTSAPTFWTDQVGVSIRMAGWIPANVETRDVVSEDETGWLVERFLGGRLVGLEATRLPDYFRQASQVVDLRHLL